MLVRARADLINSEMSGVAFSSVNQCFRQPDLKRMFETTPPITCPHSPDVLVCVDPCAGGEHSVRACVLHACALSACVVLMVYVYVHAHFMQDFAIVSMLYENGIYQVRTHETFCICAPCMRVCVWGCHANSTSRWMRTYVSWNAFGSLPLQMP